MVKSSQSNSGYQFIAHQIKTQITSGIYQHDDKLPSVRELSVLYSVNNKTIQRAFKLLESENFVYTVPGLGIFVNEDIENSKQDFEQELFLTLQKSVHKLRQASISKENITKHFTDYLEEELPDEDSI